MLHKFRNAFQPLVAALLLAVGVLMAASASHARPLGDCDNDLETGIVELQQCVNIFLGDADISACVFCAKMEPCDEVGIVDLQGSVNCFLDATTPDCPATTCGGGGGEGFCGDGTVKAPEVCDNGGACFGGSNEGNLCTTQAECPGGVCKAFGGDGCASNCTTEKTLTYTFSGAICKSHPEQSCQFNSTCVGGPTAGRPCSVTADCGAGGACVSECGVDDTCVGDGECIVAGNPNATQCFMADSTNEAKFCVAGANSGKSCSVDGDCPGSTCKAACSTAGGTCLNRSRSALVSLTLPVLIGPMIGSSVLRYGSPDDMGMVPAVNHEGDTSFAPVKVPGLVCACVRGGLDAAAHGPNNTGSGVLDCGATPIQNDVTLGQDHNTTTPGICISGANAGNACTNKCAATGMGPGSRPGKPCLTGTDCPSTGGSTTKLCNASADCASATACNIGNGPGRCVGGTSVNRACFDNSQCGGGGKCTGKCVTGNAGADCSCDGTARICDGGACGAEGTCRVAGNGGGFCMGPARFCSGGTAEGKACFNATECPGGGTCAGTGNFLQFCDSNDDCPGSLCNSIDDATCVKQDPLPPEGSGAKACLEKKEVCTQGPLLGQPCTANNLCGAGGVCGTTCSAQSPHPNVCNSPAHITLSGNGGSGSGLFLNTISIGTISDGGTCAFAALCMGGTNDAKQCFIAADCPGGTCAAAICAGKCAAGSAAGKNCLNNSDCPGSTCTPGTNFKQACTSSATCGTATCTPVTSFAVAGPPLNLGAGKGFDGIPCSDDDDAAVRGVQQTIPQTTGRALAMVADAQNIAGQQLVHRNCVQSTQGDNCATTLIGHTLDCDNLLNSANPSATGLRLANAFPTLDGTTGDAVVTTFLTAK